MIVVLRLDYNIEGAERVKRVEASVSFKLRASCSRRETNLLRIIFTAPQVINPVRYARAGVPSMGVQQWVGGLSSRHQITSESMRLRADTNDP